MNKEEANRQVQELFGSTSTLVSVEPGCAHLDGAATADQLRQLAFIVEHISCEEQGIERMTWGGLTSSNAIPSSRLGDRGPVLYISIRDELTRMGFGIPGEGSTELLILEDQINVLVPELNAIFKDFQGAVNNSATETQVRYRVEGLVLKAIETGRLTLKRTWGKP